jgi:hypothetical protein
MAATIRLLSTKQGKNDVAGSLTLILDRVPATLSAARCICP